MSTSEQPSFADDTSIPPIKASPILLRPLSFRGQDQGSGFSQMTDPFAELLEGKPELQRVVAIHDYHDSDVSNFQFDAGDEIAVYLKEAVSLGVNLRTGRAGLFPPSFVSSYSGTQSTITTARSTSQRLGLELGSSPETIDVHLRSRFRELLPDGVDPKAAFEIVKNLKSVDRHVFWGIFCIAYPAAALPFLTLDYSLHEIHALMHAYDSVVDLVDEQLTKFSDWNWKFSQYSHPPNAFGQWTEWSSIRDRVQKNLSETSAAITSFKEMFSELPEVKQLNGLLERLDILCDRIQSEVSRMDSQVRSRRLDDVQRMQISLLLPRQMKLCC